VIPIHLPALGDLRDDISLLAQFFFEKIRLKNKKTGRGIGNGTMAKLMAYSWPGNVRELKSAFEYAFVTCQGVSFNPCTCPRPWGAAAPVAGSVNKAEIKRIEPTCERNPRSLLRG